MSTAVERVASLGGSGAARGGRYCALCLATSDERRLAAPTQLERLVRQLVLHMPSLTPIASALTWGALSCAWCERRCRGALRVLGALGAAARAHALLHQLDAARDPAALGPQMKAVDAELAQARGPTLRTTDVLLIDTRADVMQLQPEGYIMPPPEIETVVIEDDPVEPPGPAGGPAPVAMATARGAAAPMRVTAGGGARGPARMPHKVSITASKQPPPLTSVAPNVAANEASEQAALKGTVPATPAVGPAPLPVPVGPVYPPAPVGPVYPPAPVGPVYPPPPTASDQVLMVLPPGAQIVSRLDGVGPKYLLLQQQPPTAIPAAPTGPGGPVAAPALPAGPPILPAGPPSTCTVSCESDDDSNDSITLSELLQRRDEFNQHSKNNTDTNKKPSEFEFYNMSDMGVIMDVKSLSEDSQTDTTGVKVNEQCFITNVKSLSENSVSAKRSSEVRKPSKKPKVDSFETVPDVEARAPPLNTERVDWEDKIPMDVISFVDATDPCAKAFQPQSVEVQQNTVSAESNRLRPIFQAKNNCVTSVQNFVTSAQNCVTSAQNYVSSAQNYVSSAPNSVTSEPRPLALISNITSATGEKSVVIDLC